MDRVLSYIQKDVEEGATLAAGGKRHGKICFFV